MSSVSGIESWEQQEKANDRKARIGTIVVHALLLLMLLLMGLDHEVPPPTEEGILINFGNVESGYGEVASSVVEEVIEDPTPPTEESTPEAVSAAEEIVIEEVETVDDPEVPSLPTEELKTEATEETEKKEETTEPVVEPKEKKEEVVEAEEVKEPEPVVDPKLQAAMEALKNKKGSQGISKPGGDQGDPSGDPTSTNYEGDKSTGLGDSGIGYDLEGRNIKVWPKINDKSQKEGKVVIRIRVDQNGKVISAEYTIKGSTTSDSQLVALAKKAAMDAEFNADSNAPSIQVGTLVFSFVLK